MVRKQISKILKVLFLSVIALAWICKDCVFYENLNEKYKSNAYLDIIMVKYFSLHKNDAFY